MMDTYIHTDTPMNENLYTGAHTYTPKLSAFAYISKQVE